MNYKEKLTMQYKALYKAISSRFKGRGNCSFVAPNTHARGEKLKTVRYTMLRAYLFDFTISYVGRLGATRATIKSLNITKITKYKSKIFYTIWGCWCYNWQSRSYNRDFGATNLPIFLTVSVCQIFCQDCKIFDNEIFYYQNKYR